MTTELSIAGDGSEAVRRELERCIERGGVALFPADTLYGLGCDPSSAAAVERIHSLKGRDERKPSAVMFFTPLAMRELIATLGPRTRDALGALLPGPVTLVVDNPERRYPLAGRDHPERLGVRLIAGPLSGVRAAMFQTSANRSGEPAPDRFDAVDPEILAGVDLAIDGGQLRGEPSTVVDVTELDSNDSWCILREGALSAAELRERLTATTG